MAQEAAEEQDYDALQAAKEQDYDAVCEKFLQKVSQRKKAFQEALSSSKSEIKAICQHRQNLLTKAKNDAAELEQIIENTRKIIDSEHGDKDGEGHEIQQLKQEIEQLNMAINEKTQERDKHKEKINALDHRLKSREESVKKTEHKYQESMTNLERASQLFHMHLGLDIKRTHHDTLVFCFTQINRSKPNEEYLLELTLEEQNYRLVGSVPEIPNLKELEDRLNATNNFSGFIVHIRKLFQKMEK